ncbi:hypothetical protein SI65_05636 [Aspergillus cristatus]|uniref:DDE-1 domain-containing protein n=1 Tax=Aspergillus cristatus TaxID=573508 RepID=A0A1E3BDK5_ASPCR|nr:hypothetical protein SI65_05636 [Aspergillus cristatus]
MSLSKESHIQMAITAWNEKKFKSILKAAKVFEVPETTLRERLAGIKPQSETRANGYKLTEIEEKSLVKQLLDADKQGFAIRPEFLHGMAQIYFVSDYMILLQPLESTGHLPLSNVILNCIGIQFVIVYYSEPVTYTAIQEHGIHEDDIWNFDETGFAMGLCTTSKIGIQFVIVYYSEPVTYTAIQEHGIHEDDIWNFDETGFAMGLCTTSKVITAAERSERPHTVTQGNHEWVTIIECIGSSSCHILPLIILKGKEQQATWYQEPNLPQEWQIATSPNGWTTDAIGLHWLKEVFEPFSKCYSVGAKRLLILDGHSSHLTAEFDSFCKQHVIICLCMPPHTSHLLQPLDVGVFGPLKRAYGKLIEDMMMGSVTVSSNRNLLVDYLMKF